MRSEIFLFGVLMVVVGPVLAIFAASSCLGTILSGNVFGCLSDLPFFIFGGVLFVAGIVVALVGVIVSDPYQGPYHHSAPASGPQGGQVACKKCGKINSYGLFACPFCGERAS